jgi:hypothetical protein
MAARIAAVGLVTVSLRRSTIESAAIIGFPQNIRNASRQMHSLGAYDKQARPETHTLVLYGSLGAEKAPCSGMGDTRAACIRQLDRVICEITGQIE